MPVRFPARIFPVGSCAQFNPRTPKFKGKVQPVGQNFYGAALAEKRKGPMMTWLSHEKNPLAFRLPYRRICSGNGCRPEMARSSRDSRALQRP